MSQNKDLFLGVALSLLIFRSHFSLWFAWFENSHSKAEEHKLSDAVGAALGGKERLCEGV